MGFQFLSIGLLILVDSLFEPLVRYTSPRLKQTSHLCSVKLVASISCDSIFPFSDLSVMLPCFPDNSIGVCILFHGELLSHGTVLMLMDFA